MWKASSRGYARSRNDDYRNPIRGLIRLPAGAATAPRCRTGGRGLELGDGSGEDSGRSSGLEGESGMTSDWATCPACGLKHRARGDGTCPRCAKVGRPTPRWALVAMIIGVTVVMAAAGVFVSAQLTKSPRVVATTLIAIVSAGVGSAVSLRRR